MKDLQEIIDDAPEGATHICASGEYYDLKNFACWNGHFWVDDYDLVDLRSLADIKQILELQEQNHKLKETLNDAIRFNQTGEASKFLFEMQATIELMLE